MGDKNIYKLKEFSDLIGVSTIELIRWDKNGVLVADRIDGCHRFYTQKHIDKLQNLRSNQPHLLSRKKHFLYKELTGLRFGKLTVIKRTDDCVSANGHRCIQWLCKCDCGSTVVLKGSSLISGYNKSCGCSRYGDNETQRMWKEFDKIGEADAKKMLQQYIVFKPTKYVTNIHNNTGKFQDLTGHKFGLWTVLERAETRKYRGGGQTICWLCRCECGTIKSVPGRDLKSGASQSCGCLISMSQLEYHVKNYLIEHGIQFEYQKKYSDLQGIGGKLLSYDFLVLNQNVPVCFIECQGEQHYRPIKKFGGAKQLLRQTIHDKLKKDYANNVLRVPLYEVDYTRKTKDCIYELLDSLNLSVVDLNISRSNNLP